MIHLRGPVILREAWQQASAATCASAAEERPLLRTLDGVDDRQLERLLLVEEMLWQCVNRERYLVYQHPWKDFYRAWQQGPGGGLADGRAFFPAARACLCCRAGTRVATGAARHVGCATGGLRPRPGTGRGADRRPLPGNGPGSHAAGYNSPMTHVHPTAAGDIAHPTEPVYPERYYEILARDFGEEKARWARLPYAERMRELESYHAHFNTPDDLSPWPAELDGGVDRG